VKIKLRVIYILILVSIYFLLISPKQIAWGGWTYQTVPTFGPSRTPTINSPSITPTGTRTPTRTFTGAPSSTSTTISTTQPTLFIPTVTLTSTVAITIVHSGATLTSSPEISPTTELSATESPSETSTNVSELIPTEIDKSSSVISKTPIQTSTPSEMQSVSLEPQVPPAWLFPFLGSILLVTFFIFFRLLLRKKTNKN